MKILLLTAYYWPEHTGNAPFATGLARYLASRGHDVTVGTTYPHYPQWKWQVSTVRWSGREQDAGVAIRRSRMVLPRQPRSAAWRIVYDMSAGVATLVNAFGMARPDVIVAMTAPIQVAIAAGLLATLWRRPLVTYILDMPVDLALSVGMLRPGVISRVGLSIESFGYKLADRLVVLGDGFSQKLIDRGIPASRIAHLPIWLDMDEVRPAERTKEICHLLEVSPKNKVLLHYGNMGEKQALRTVIDAAGLLADRFADLRVVFVGAGPQRDALELQARREGYENVRFIGLQPKERTPEILAAADIALLNQHAGVLDSVVPQKLVAYMAAGRPVLAAASPDSGAAGVVRDSGCGIVVAPGDPKALADGVGRLLAAPDRLADLGKKGREYAEVHYDSKIVLKRWENLLTEVGGPGRRF